MKTALLLAFLIGCAHTQPGRIDVAFVDTPVHEALRSVATQAHVNIDADPDLTGTVTLKVRARPWDEVLRRIAEPHGWSIVPEGPNVVRVSASAATPTSFTGAPMTAQFDDTPIRDAAKVFADASRLAIDVDPDVDVAVTMHLHNAPWDLALDHLARKYGLRVERTATAIRIRR
jgi:type II secretory pathway component HofQ